MTRIGCQCARCGQYTLTVAGLEPVTFGQITVAICSRCSRAGGASRLRAVYRDAKKGKHMDTLVIAGTLFGSLAAAFALQKMALESLFRIMDAERRSRE